MDEGLMRIKQWCRRGEKIPEFADNGRVQHRKINIRTCKLWDLSDIVSDLDAAVVAGDGPS